MGILMYYENELREYAKKSIGRTLDSYIDGLFQLLKTQVEFDIDRLHSETRSHQEVAKSCKIESDRLRSENKRLRKKLKEFQSEIEDDYTIGN